VLGLLRELNQGGQTVLLVTHDESLAKGAATRIETMRDGRWAA
jgi:ABC-type lipoprotein export system ATPase subunit